MAGDFEELAEHAKGFANDMTRGRDAAGGIHSSFTKMLAAFGGYEAVKHVVMDIVKRTEVWRGLSHSINEDNFNRLKVDERRNNLFKTATEEYLKLKDAGKLGTREHVAQLDVLRGQMREFRAQQGVAEELTRLGRVRLLLMGAEAALAIQIANRSKDLNQNLIEANAQWSNRVGLLYRTLQVQGHLGVSFGEATQAARALVHYGLDTEKTYRENLRIVVEMNQGLGVSMTEAAKLASIVERQLHGSFGDVSNVIAQIVDDLSLSGDEAVRLAEKISLAMGRLRPGMSAAGLPEVLKLVGRYESALKEVGGAPGSIEHLITQLTTLQGVSGAGALGVNPDFLTTSEGVQTVMDRFAEYGKRLVGQSQGWERQMRLDVLAQQFNVSAEQANQLLMAVDRANQQQIGTISLHERWRQQMHSVDAGIVRLTNSVTALLQGALYPFTFVINAVLNTLADVVGWIGQFEGLAVGAMVVVGAGVLATIGSFFGLARAMWQVVITSRFAVAAQRELAAAQALASARSTLGLGGGSGFLGGILSVLRPVLTLTAGYFALIAAALGVVAYFAHKIWSETKRLNSESEGARRIIIDRQRQLELKGQEAVYREARIGTPEGLRTALSSLFTQAGGLFQEETDPRQRLAKQQEWIAKQQTLVGEELVPRGSFTRTMFDTLAERSPKEVQTEKEMLDVTKHQDVLAQKTLDAINLRTQMDLSQRQEEEVEKAKADAARIRGWRW
jgi:hypothetical protein